MTQAEAHLVMAATSLAERIKHYAPSAGEDDDEEVIVPLSELRALARVIPAESDATVSAGVTSTWAHTQSDVTALPTHPEGWRLVPVEPTEEMRDAARRAYATAGPIAFSDFYTAMVDAAPPPPSGEV